MKFLVADKLREVGGLVFVAHGSHYANELGRRNCVTGEVWQDKPPLRLTLNKATSVDIAWQGMHCTGRGVMKLHRSGAASCRGYGSARLEDGRINRSPNSSFLENCPGSWLESIPSVS